MFTYKFAIRVNDNPVTKEQSRQKIFGVEEPYDMLNFLCEGCSDANYVKDIVENLKKVISIQQEEFGYWGHDFTYIKSYAEKSLVTHADMQNEKEDVQLQIELSTSWLLKLLEDWIRFLEKEEDGTETIIHGVWVSPLH